MARGGAPLCNHSRCSKEATRHVQYRSGGTYVKNHFCVAHEISETRKFQQSLGLSPTTRPLDDKCRRGSC